MKVFISHSSRDKWAARRISEDICKLGHNTFLDEKDIRTGESIDGTIKTHLKDSDHLLILLSPESIKSEWVLIELGGAFALEKKVIPIMLYVSANDIPKIISLSLARDINEIDNYYNELSTTTPKLLPKHTYSHTLKVGDKVKIIPVPTIHNIVNPGRGIYWGTPMDYYAERKAKIVKLDEKDETYKLDIDSSEFYWEIEWLIKDEN
jgi:hypothetical protein